MTDCWNNPILSEPFFIGTHFSSFVISAVCSGISLGLQYYMFTHVSAFLLVSASNAESVISSKYSVEAACQNTIRSNANCSAPSSSDQTVNAANGRTNEPTIGGKSSAPVNFFGWVCLSPGRRGRQAGRHAGRRKEGRKDQGWDRKKSAAVGLILKGTLVGRGYRREEEEEEEDTEFSLGDCCLIAVNTISSYRLTAKF